jgi:uncharacterized RDD family membrane protein YckC
VKAPAGSADVDLSAQAPHASKQNYISKRAAAAIIDGAICYFLSVAFASFLGSFLRITNFIPVAPLERPWSWAPSAEAQQSTDEYFWLVVFMVVLLLVGVVYHVLLETGPWRATVGKRLMEIEVVDAYSLERMTYPTALGRILVKYASNPFWDGLTALLAISMLGLGDGLQGFAILAGELCGAILFVVSVVMLARSKQEISLHDRLTDTLVIGTPQARIPSSSFRSVFYSARTFAKMHPVLVAVFALVVWYFVYDLMPVTEVTGQQVFFTMCLAMPSVFALFGKGKRWLYVIAAVLWFPMWLVFNAYFTFLLRVYKANYILGRVFLYHLLQFIPWVVPIGLLLAVPLFARIRPPGPTRRKLALAIGVVVYLCFVWGTMVKANQDEVRSSELRDIAEEVESREADIKQMIAKLQADWAPKATPHATSLPTNPTIDSGPRSVEGAIAIPSPEIIDRSKLTAGDQVSVGKYVVRIYTPTGGSGNYRGAFEISLGSSSVYSLYGGQFSVLKEGPGAAGANLAGDGAPGVVIMEWTGGAHCCVNFFLFELRNVVQGLGLISGGRNYSDPDESGAAFESDPSGNGVLVRASVQINEGPAMTFTVGSSFWLRYVGTHYQIALDQSRRPAPSWTELQEKAEHIAASQDWRLPSQDEPSGGAPNELWRDMLDLICSGNSDVAIQYFDLAWPAERPGKEAALARFNSDLHSDPYWEQIQELNAH